MRGLELVLQPYSFQCPHFKPDKDAEEQVRTVVLAPLTVRQPEKDRTQISWACSAGDFCAFEKCVYSRGRKSESGGKRVVIPLLRR